MAGETSRPGAGAAGEELRHGEKGAARRLSGETPFRPHPGCGSRELIERAHRWRKVAGGGMRQAGILAAAGLYALEHHVARLKDDHANAGALAVGLAKLAAVKVEPPQTNMVFVHLGKAHAHELPRFLGSRGITVLPGETLRLVTHLDVDRADIPFVVGAFEDYFRSLTSKQ